MSDRPSLRLSALARMGLITTSLIGSLAFGGGSLVASAQDATPSPMAECVPSEMVTGMATPVASPEAGEEPVGSPADEESTAAIVAWAENAIACAGDPAALATLVTPNLVHALGDYDSIEAAAADGFFDEAPFGNATTGAVTAYDDGSFGIVFDYMQTEYQAVSEEWILVQVGEDWKLDNIKQGLAVEVDGDSAAVGVNLGENEDGTYYITPNTESVAATDVLILQAINLETNKEAHELVVVKLPEGADPAGIVDGTIKEEDVEFIGQVFVIEPGTSVDMTLVNLPAGVYTLLCFFPNPDGEPHAFHGMIAPFEVTAPAE